MNALSPWEAGRSYANFVEHPVAAGRASSTTTPSAGCARCKARRTTPSDLFLANHPVN